MRIGAPELLVMFAVGLFWLVPVAAGVWGLVTLYRIRTTQEEMLRRLDVMERALHGGRPA